MTSLAGPPAPFSLFQSLARALVAVLFTAGALAQEFRIIGILTNELGQTQIQYTANTNSYYILLRGAELENIRQARELELGANGASLISDPAIPETTAFYRVHEVPLANALDSDSDGIDDVYELMRRPRLDPLSLFDANLDPDQDRRTTLEEYQRGTDPFVAERPTVPILNYPTNATTASFVIFSGEAPTNTVIRVEGGAAYLTNTVDASGRFELTVPLVANRLNRLFVTAVDEFGEASPPAPVDILQDSTPPFVFVDFPTNGMVLTTETTLVAGRVGDALSGFLGLSVTVTNLSSLASNPSAAGGEARVDVGIGPNGTFERGQLQLVVGENRIRVLATDRLGNAYPTNITVTRIEPTGPRLLAAGGDLQETNILRRLAEPLVVKLTSESGAPLAGQRVTFQVTRSDGRILPLNTNQLAADITQNPDYSTNGSMTVPLLTDAAGEARVWYRMGTDAGHGNNRVTVSASNVFETVFFCASATHLPARQINIGSGNNQRGETLGPAPEPLKVWVSDGNNPVAGVPVTFRVIQGNGTLVPILADDGASPSGPGLRGSRPATSLALLPRRSRGDEAQTSSSSRRRGNETPSNPPPGSSATSAGSAFSQSLLTSSPTSSGRVRPAGEPDPAEITVLTGKTGHAEVDYTFGPEGGQQLIEASFPNQFGLPATFVMTALERIPGQPTSFSGLIQDNAFQPLGNAYVELSIAGATNTTYSDTQGRFAFANIPAGAGHLFVNGWYVNSLGTNAIPTNSFPPLSYAVTVVPNAANSLPTPVLLPRLNPANGQWYYGTNDLVVTCEGIDGLKMTVRANSMKHPGGLAVTPQRPAYVTLNQVHHDDIPMPMPDGASPPFAWTLQPGGATFDPPVAVEYPNMSGLAPGAAAYFLTFNHDTERFEIVASGHVTGDGSTILSDPGAGLTISGWGCNCPPYAVAGQCCSVSISGPNQVKVGCEIDLGAAASPPGGTFGWSVVGGGAHLLSTSGTNVKLRGFSPGTVTIHVTYRPPGVEDPSKWCMKDYDVEVIDQQGADCCIITLHTFESGLSQELLEPPDANSLNKSSSEFIAHQTVVAIFEPANIWQGKQVRWTFSPIRNVGNLPSSGRHSTYLESQDVSTTVDSSGTTATSTLSGAGEALIRLNVPLTAFNKCRLAVEAVNFPADCNRSALLEVPAIVVIDPGHGGAASGASSAGCRDSDPATPCTYEKTMSLDYAFLLANSLSARALANDFNLQIFLTRYADYDLPLSARPAVARARNADIFVSLHFNAGSANARGTLALVRSQSHEPPNSNYGADRQLAQTIVEAVATATSGGRNSGVCDDVPPCTLESPLAVLSDVALGNRQGNSPCRSCLVELEFITNPDVDSVYNIIGRRDYFRGLVADAMAAAIIRDLTQPAQLPDPFAPAPLPAAGIQATRLQLQQFQPAHNPPGGLDASWAVLVNGQSVGVNSDGSFLIPNISAPDQFGPDGPGSRPDFLGDDFVRLTGSSTRDGQTRYVFSEFFQLRQGATYSITNLTFTDVPPRQPESIKIVAPVQTLSVGSKVQLRVIARYADGTTNDVTRRNDWTVYRLSNPRLATISPDGELAPLGQGQFYVTAGNEAATAVVRLVAVSRVTVRGQILDEEGRPAEGVEIRLRGIEVDPLLTTADGSFAFVDLPTHQGPVDLVAWLPDSAGGGWSASLRGVDLSSPGIVSVPPLRLSRLPPAFQQGLVAGSGHTLALRTDGSLWAWGRNDFGQVGDGSTDHRHHPVLIRPGDRWQAVAAGESHTVALQADGSLWAWGNNDSGQLGDGTRITRTNPVAIQPLERWQALAAGVSHTVALRADGTLCAWGANWNGQIGNGTDDDQLNPLVIQPGQRWRAVAAGTGHTVALRADGSLWTWGANRYGQIGDGTTEDRPSPVPLQPGERWQALAAGISHTVALRADGSLWTWGSNFYGQLGDGTTDHRLLPVAIQSTDRWQAVAAGSVHTVALRLDGSLWAWGHNRDGQIGDGTANDHAYPAPIQPSERWLAVAAGDRHTVALRADGSLWAWGDDAFGQLGDEGPIGEMLTPATIRPGERWKAVSAGDFYTVALRDDGSLWAWGENLRGQLGNGNVSLQMYPTLIQPGERWLAVDVGEGHTVALRGDGSLWAWGGNRVGQLGDGSEEDRWSPIIVAPEERWRSVSAGYSYTVAVRADNSLWAWGENENGQLGDGTTINRRTPTAILPQERWQAVSAGFNHTLALHVDGSLWVWGSNFYGQLGTGDRDDHLIPVAILPGRRWQSVAGGYLRSMALRVNGEMWAWGSGSLGLSPLPFLAEERWLTMALGVFHTVALRADGSLWAWGDNHSGQLGDGTQLEQLSPVPIQPNEVWQTVAAGFDHTVAVRSDGTLWAWGNNEWGQLGLGPWRQVLGGTVWGPEAP